MTNLFGEFVGTLVLLSFGCGACANLTLARSKAVGGGGGGAKFAAGFGPYMVAILIWGLGLSFGGPTGYALNPARDLGPRIAHAILPIAGKGGSDWGYSWIPVVGPFIGGVLSFVIGKGMGIL